MWTQQVSEVAPSWFITTISRTYGRYIELVDGGYKLTYNWEYHIVPYMEHMGNNASTARRAPPQRLSDGPQDRGSAVDR